LGRIPDQIVERLRDRVDIVDLIGRYVGLRRAGRSYKGLCPFHDEKTPSFSVSPERGSYHCFGCQEGGNAFTFLMKLEGLTFPEAVRALARENGVEIPEAVSGERGQAERLFEAAEVAQACYREALGARGNPGADYLARRGLDAALIEGFGVGYAPPAWDTLVRALRARGIEPELGLRAGLLAARSSGGHYDLLRGRVTFPIRDVRGRVVGFGGRALAPGQEPKYLNSTESPIFRKRESFFGFPAALEPMRRGERAVVVEGYFDLLALRRAGLGEVLATCGTALTPEHARGLRRRVREVVLCFDGDEAGQRAVERALEVLLPAGLRVRAALLPPAEDPDTLLAGEGAAALRARVEAAPPALEFAIRRATARGVATPFEKADAVAAVVPLLRLVVSPVERGEFATRLAVAAGTEPRLVEAALRAAASGRDAGEVLRVAPRRRRPEERKVGLLLRCLLDRPELLEGLPPELPALVEAALPGHPLVRVARALVEAPGAGPAAWLEAVAGALDPEAAAQLRELAASEHEIDAPAAARTRDDVLRWLERHSASLKQHELTARLRDPGADVAELLREKQRLRFQPPAESPS